MKYDLARFFETYVINRGCGSEVFIKRLQEANTFHLSDYRVQGSLIPYITIDDKFIYSIRAECDCCLFIKNNIQYMTNLSSYRHINYHDYSYLINIPSSLKMLDIENCQGLITDEIYNVTTLKIKELSDVKCFYIKTLYISREYSKQHMFQILDVFPNIKELFFNGSQVNVLEELKIC